MCGLCGVVTAGDRPADAAIVRAMAAKLAHRGPDGEGVWAEGPAALGHRRLAVIDLSPDAAQPLANEDGSVRIVFNGEIYNFDELRPDLEKRGHRFRSKSDTEVIVHAWEEWGDACVERLLGMFAFAVWDARRRRLFAARDRVGKKPFLYALHGGTLRFASEMQALLADPGVPRRLDPTALDHYLHYQYIPAPLSIFRDVRKLPPGHRLVFEGGNLRIERYWDLDYRLKDRYDSPAEAEERFRTLFDDAVRRRLVSDVPLGAFLSGGIDSSAVVEAMARLTGRPVRTFTIGFSEGAYSEVAEARETARRVGAVHQELLVQPRALAILPALVRHYGEPFADASALPTYYVSRMAREGVTVALSGDGGDESFLGYPRVAAIETAARLTALPRPVRALLAAAARLLPECGSPRSLLRRVRRFLTLEGDTAERHFTELVAYFGTARRRGLYTEEFARSVEGDASGFMERLLREAPAGNLTERALYAEARSYLPDDLMAKVDIAAMMNSLEVRSPFLDHRLMEFAARLPLRFKKDGVRTKVFLKRALAARLPAGLLHRPKQGFAVPLEEWFRGELAGFARETLLSAAARSRGWFREEAVKGYLDEHGAGAADHSNRLWALLFLELWLQNERWQL